MSTKLHIEYRRAFRVFLIGAFVSGGLSKEPAPGRSFAPEPAVWAKGGWPVNTEHQLRAKA